MGLQTVKKARRAGGFMATAVAALALVASACSNGPSTSSGSSFAPAQPTDPLVGCTYTINGQVQSYLPTGRNPHFAAFSPDSSAESALHSIKTKGGTGIVDTFILPAGAELRSGPSPSAPVVGKISETDELQLYDPILWTDSAGGQWLASFIACGGRNLYWVSLADLQKTNPAFAKGLRSQLTQLRTARPYPETAMASLLPIVINTSKEVVWKDRSITFNVGRAELALSS